MKLDDLRRHTAVATGNFQKLFGELDVPPLPAAVVQLARLATDEEAELSQYASVIRSDSALAAGVLRLVRSAAMGVRHRVADIQRAVSLLGTVQVRSLAMALGATRALPQPSWPVFKREAFWQDALARALVAKALSPNVCPVHEGEAFAVALLQNLAVPVLLEACGDYYEPVLAAWPGEPYRLAELEQQRFGWNHAEAGAWIVRSWGLPDAVVCAVGLHHADWDQLAELELDRTPVAAGMLAALWPSVLKRTEPDLARWSRACHQHAGLAPTAQQALLSDVQEQLTVVGEGFGLTDIEPFPSIDPA